MLPLSHDEVVHGKGSLLSKMAGDDWQRFANLRALYAWMWALPGAPLLFMGAELAPWTEWNDGGGLPWHLLEHAPHRGVRDLLVDAQREADRVAGGVGARPRADRASSGSTPTTPSTRCTPSSGGRTPARMLSRASPTSRRCPAADTGRAAVGGRVADRGRHRRDPLRRWWLVGRTASQSRRTKSLAGPAVLGAGRCAAAGRHLARPRRAP